MFIPPMLIEPIWFMFEYDMFGLTGVIFGLACVRLGLPFKVA